jgi:hypothetical protein
MSVPTVVPLPCCPFCGADLKELAFYNWVMPAWVILCIHCPHCRKALHFATVPIEQPEQRVQLPS